MSKDWSGNQKSVFANLAATSHGSEERQEHDFYATEPKAADLLHAVETFPGGIWESSCGQGHLAERFKQLGHSVVSTDFIDRGYGTGCVDFFQCKNMPDVANIITNPPYKYAERYISKAMELLPQGGKLALFLKVQFLEGKARKKLFQAYPPKTVYVSSARLCCAKNGDFEKYKGSTAVAYCWMVWCKNYTGDTIVRWIN
jgi:hypothetical protein